MQMRFMKLLLDLMMIGAGFTLFLVFLRFTANEHGILSD